VESPGTPVTCETSGVENVPPPRRVTRSRVAVALLLIGLVAAFVPGLAAGSGFRPCGWISISQGSVTSDCVVIVRRPIGRSTLCDLVAFEPGWTAAAAALLAMAPLYVWWRRSGVPFARVVGVAACVAAAAAVCVFVLVPESDHEQAIGGCWWTMPLGGLLMAAAFCVAPAPARARDD
jgi:hypothetical protein